MKHWTEPNGLFIINIPIDWQCKNIYIKESAIKLPYSFESYDNPLVCFQLSCYSLDEKDINPAFPDNRSNSKIKWFPKRVIDDIFDVTLFYAQVEDLLCIAKCIYESKFKNDERVAEQLNKVKLALDSFVVIPNNDRNLAVKLDKYDNFLSSLAASIDLLNRAYQSNSFIEQVAILANQIDAFLRLAIVLKYQLDNETDDFDVKYLFQREDDRTDLISETMIYVEASKMKVIDSDIKNELLRLYKLRNKVIHRYIISFLKTREIAKISYEYSIIKEKIRLLLKSYEEMQFGKGFGIYGRGYSKKDKLDINEFRRLYSFINDKHLIKRFKIEL